MFGFHFGAFFIILSLAFSSGAWARFGVGPLTARDYALEISRIQMETHVHADTMGESFKGPQFIKYIDVIPHDGLNGRILTDPGTALDTTKWIRNLGIVTEVNGKRALRIFLHPADTTFRDLIYEELREQEDRIIGAGKIEAFPSGSRSLFVVSGNEILQIKMSTGTVNGRFEGNKSFSPTMAFSSVMNSASLRRLSPGSMMEEPLAVKISENYAYVIRKFADFTPNTEKLWVPGYAFGLSAIESSQFASFMGKKLSVPVLRQWVRLSTRVGVFRELSNNHAQNLVVALHRMTGDIVDAKLIDALDLSITREDLQEGLRDLGLTRSPFGDPPLESSHRLNRLLGWGFSTITPPVQVDEAFREDTADISVVHIERMVRNLFRRDYLEPLWSKTGIIDPDRSRLVGYLTELFKLYQDGVMPEARRQQIVNAIVKSWSATDQQVMDLWGVDPEGRDNFSRVVHQALRERAQVAFIPRTCEGWATATH